MTTCLRVDGIGFVWEGGIALQVSEHSQRNTGRRRLQGRSNGAAASTSAAAGAGAAAAAAAQPQRLGKLGKNPAVQTDFLPDVDRERDEERMREQLKREYELRQQVCTSNSALCRQ